MGGRFAGETMMTTQPPNAVRKDNSGSGFSFLFASLATAVAGFLDAVGYNQLDHLYVSFMSGNSTHFGMALAAAEWGQALTAGYLIAIFVIGTFLGTLILDAASRPLLTILAGELVFCLAAMVLTHAGRPWSALVVIALMMGMQNVIHQNVHGTDAGKGFITGALFGFGQSLARAVTGAGQLVKAAVYGSTWLSFILGVVGGAHSIVGCGLLPSLAIAFVGLMLLTVMAVVRSIGHGTSGNHSESAPGF